MLELDEFRKKLDDWLDQHADELAPDYTGAGTLDEQMAQIAKVRHLTFDAGWARYGWPERVGGLAGSTLLRAYLSETLTARDLVYSGVYSLPEVLGPSFITFAAPELSAAMIPPLLRGDEVWCQGFSEPGTGSNLASLTCRAVSTDEGWRVTGQKVWTSLAQYAQRCVLLTRTGTIESAHRGITALFLDMDTPGITARPIETMHGEPEFCETFFDDVLVPFGRTLGKENEGWAFAMDLLPYERSTALWQRAAFLHRRLQDLLDAAEPDLVDPMKLSEVTQLVYAFRARSRATQHRMASGAPLGAETSIDKVLLATAEQAVFDLVADAVPAEVTIGDDEKSERWRTEFLYSRAASIYGGSAEIQRNIIARRLLDLGERPMIEGEDLDLFERSLRNATEQHTGAALDAALAELGWSDALSFDPRAAVSRLFEVQGEAGATSSALDHVVAFAIGRELDGATAVVLPAIGRWHAPGQLGDKRMAVRGVVTAVRPSMLVVADADDRHVAAVVDTSALKARWVHGVDPSLGLVEFHGDVDVDDVQPVDWAGAVALGQLAVAHELVGASRKALALAREHALDRIQFGQPIARFQAVRHRLAETLVALETASAALDAAWLDQSPVTAAMAKATAGRSARTASRHCQQVLAGIGFTTEHDLHRYVRRILILDQLFGSHATLTKRLGEDLLTTRTLPRLLPL